MSKQLSTYERKMQSKQFRQVYNEKYKTLLFSELLIAVMESDEKSVRRLAEEARLFPL